MLGRLWAQLRKAALRARIGQRWTEPADGGGDGSGLARRRYPDYDAYLQHQALKREALRPTSLDGHAHRFEVALAERLARCGVGLQGRSALCLGAREGAEVRAFIGLGAFAVGLDLNPGRDNRWVVQGDFHRLQYGDETVDVVYSNSIDHALELERLLAEVLRVLKPAGTFLVEVGRGTEEGGGRGFYEALSWPRTEHLLERIAAAGFERGTSMPFEIPWIGALTPMTKRATAERG